MGSRILLIGIGATAMSVVCASHLMAAEGSPEFEVYGFAQTDYVQDYRRVNPAWDDALRPSRIPTNEGEFGSDGQAIIGVRQSRFGVRADVPVLNKRLKTKFEFDLFGVGVDEGQTTIRPRHIYGEWGQWLAGQTHSLFMDIDVFPNVIEYWGPSGVVFLRNPQIRWTPVTGQNNFAVAIERPNDDIDAGQIRDVDPNLGNNIRSDEKVPDLTAQYRRNGNWGHAQLGGILRRIGYETLQRADNEPSGNEVGWGVALTSGLKLRKRDKLILSGVYGAGIASYMNDGGTDLAPDGTLGNISAKAVPLFGITAYYDLYWGDRWSTSAGYSRTQVENTSFQANNAFFRGEYATINLLHTPNKDVLVGAEFQWGERTDNDGNKGSDIRTQISFKYTFSSGNIIEGT